MHNRPLHVTREVVKEVPVLYEVPASLPAAATRAAVKETPDDTITETKLQLITMLDNERAFRLCLSSVASVHAKHADVVHECRTAISWNASETRHFIAALHSQIP